MATDPSTTTTGEDTNTATAANAAGFFGASIETAIERAKYTAPSGSDKRGKAEQLTPTAPRLHFKR